MLVVAVTKVYPLGKASCTVTPVAVVGPLLVIRTVKVTFSPTLGVVFDTDLSNSKSAEAIWTVTVSVKAPVWALEATAVLV